MHGRTFSLGMKLLMSFLIVDLVMIAIGGFNLATQASLHQRLSAVSSRDIVPLSHLRTAQNMNHTIVITAFAAGQSQDPAVKAGLLDNIPGFQRVLTESFASLRKTVPADMSAQVEELIAAYDLMVEKDQAYRANGNSPQVKQFANAAEQAYLASEAIFDKVAAAFVADTATQQAATTAAYHRSRTVTWILLLVGVATGLILAVTIVGSLRRRTALILDGLDRFAQGDVTATVDVPGTDEIAQMGKALNASIAATRNALAQVNTSAVALADSASGLSHATEETSNAVREAGDAVEDVVLSAGTVTRTVDNVASSTVELAASIRDISENAQQAARVAGNAVGVVEATNATISQLGNSSQEIGNVVQVIQSIAAQTSLLALNATIEAARAGEAGRGFAVVAGEVKDLARETAEATDSVITQVQAIQADTEGAISAIAQIGEIIQQINGFQGTIAAAVEEQSVTTDSISASISEALQITRQIATTVEQVSTAAQGGTAALKSTRVLADDVASMGEQLRQVVSSFRL